VIEQKTPWLFEVCTLISEHPSLCHAGLGNNDTEIDTSLLLLSPTGDDDQTMVEVDAEINTFEPKSPSSSWVTEDYGDVAAKKESKDATGGDEEDSDIKKPVLKKQKVVVTAKTKKTLAHPGILAPAAVHDTSK
jgi:hypothetical protein